MGSTTEADGFEREARAFLGSTNQNQLVSLLRIRSHYQAALRACALQESVTAEVINAVHIKYCGQALQLLGPELFEQLFDVPADVKAKLVDPEIFARQKLAA
ncbi:hypothetical protein FNU76_12550 [Chitinimonas arctica]|uniref:Uncharacterized protein n=1 Tax=Chitinimonas arctica TaxID=2594795 RepID=A0A516SG33_9NEIS|nr:hypothetical protein [Chitinimonas arctica]QDQ27124.1 hypothetical protein FNU76_12550 [Chitinimonas arctica]